MNPNNIEGRPLLPDGAVYFDSLEAGDCFCINKTADVELFYVKLETGLYDGENAVCLSSGVKVLVNYVPLVSGN